MTNIKDLAQMAGVSVATVSRVINHHPYVSEEKRQAVLEAIESSNYQQNINAVHLSKGKTRLLGVVLPFSDHPYFALLLKGIANEALAHNYKLVLFQTSYMESREIEALQMLRQKQIDALIFCSRSCDWSTIEEYLSFGPIVFCENMTGKPVSSTYVNHYDVFFKALNLLYHQGHMQIGYCIGRRQGTNSRGRALAYTDFLNQYDLPYRLDYIIDECLYFEDGAKVVKQIKQMSSPPTALLVTSDQVAAGIMTCCQKEGIEIPDDLALIGFDNQPIAGMMDITTIEIPHLEIGKNLFLQALNGWEKAHQEVSATFIERSTTN
ncbi:LacI family DNA-binding transcriptional regulator [Texcoconibacillus texcoconensis]|uniref:DNA-binding LacI/PurR family transcriptional regulator n=1 Tax=Texcoconibacillus texcoconensis TaxID=1095777 RepID=A0A840QMB2_9BACI|nr:LacI family DNA-binding transcriptional regulator [Texcoconibacillus texcoconensis]MBB5172519.1 DNA-binding LacI/PurR family transcriptional regulator [Texcoconibacillus texcoconensis]